MQTTSNSDRMFLIELRETNKKFLELDTAVRTLAFRVGKGGGTKADEIKYKKLEKQRDEMLQKYIDENSPAPAGIEFGEKTDKALADKLETYCKKFPNAKFLNIVFMGATGTGKTYCAKIVAKKLQQRGFRVHFNTAYNLIRQVRIDEIPPCDLLIIDDLGAEPDQRNNNEYLYTIIAERYENNLPFIITTNLTQEQLHGIYDDRIYSRIFDKYKTARPIEFNGNDLRLS